MNYNYYPNLYPFEAEMAILGAILINNDIWLPVSEKLEKNDFCKKDHEILFEMINFLISKKEPVDKITLMNLLKKNSHLNELSDKDFIEELIRSTPDIKNISFYIDIVKKKSILRKLISASKEIINVIIQKSDKDDIYEILDFAENIISKIINKVDNNNNNNFENIGLLLHNTVKELEKKKIGGKDATEILSGFKKLDDITAGFHKSDLIVIAGRPSMGKTTLAINIAENVIIKQKKPVVIFSMEMSAEQIAMRLLSSTGKIKLNELRNGTFAQSDWPKLQNSTTLLAKMQNLIFINDCGALTPFEIKSKVKSIEKDIKDIGLIIIDYIQLIKIPGTHESRARELADVSRSLKILAKDLNVPIIVLSQLNRSSELRNDKKPIISDLKESGAIEQDADLIILLHKNNLNNDDIEINIAKQRNGPTGIINLKFIKEYCKFEEI